jgi:hypothetical protein
LEGNDFFFQNLCRNYADEFPIEMEERSSRNCGKEVITREVSCKLRQVYGQDHIIANNSLKHLIISTKNLLRSQAHISKIFGGIWHRSSHSLWFHMLLNFPFVLTAEDVLLNRPKTILTTTNMKIRKFYHYTISSN